MKILSNHKIDSEESSWSSPSEVFSHLSQSVPDKRPFPLAQTNPVSEKRDKFIYNLLPSISKLWPELNLLDTNISVFKIDWQYLLKLVSK